MPVLEERRGHPRLGGSVKAAAVMSSVSLYGWYPTGGREARAGAKRIASGWRARREAFDKFALAALRVRGGVSQPQHVVVGPDAGAVVPGVATANMAGLVSVGRPRGLSKWVQTMGRGTTVGIDSQVGGAWAGAMWMYRRGVCDG